MRDQWSMSNVLKVSLLAAIYSLDDKGWSQRRTAREPGLNRETVGRYLRLAKPAISTAGFEEPCQTKPVQRRCRCFSTAHSCSLSTCPVGAVPLSPWPVGMFPLAMSRVRKPCPQPGGDGPESGSALPVLLDRSCNSGPVHNRHQRTAVDRGRRQARPAGLYGGHRHLRPHPPLLELCTRIS